MGRNVSDVTDQTVVRVARRVHEIDLLSGWSRTLAIGKLILDEFFGGDTSAWLSRRGRESSLRRLAARPECPLEKSALAEAVGVYVAVLDDPGIQARGTISPSHVARVLALEPTTRRRLLAEAEEQGMSVRGLALRVRQVKGYVRSVPTRQPSTRRKVLNGVQEGLAALRSARLFVEESGEWSVLDGPDLARLLCQFEEELALMRKPGGRSDVQELLHKTCEVALHFRAE